MSWHRESSALLRVDRAALWAAIRDVGGWPQWCGGLSDARPSSDGAAVDLVPSGLVGAVHRRTAPAALVFRDESGRIVVEQPQPGGCTRVTLSIEADDGRDDEVWRLRQVVEVEGPLVLLAQRGLALPLARGFPDDVMRLNALLAAQGGARPAPDPA